MIWNFCIRRPVFTSVIWIVVAIFGIYGFNQMGVREQPDVDPPLVSVNVVLPGAEPEVLETEVVEPLEEQINTIEGLKELTSTARDQVATITAEFELWRDIDVAAQDVRDRVNRARRELPDQVEEPIVRKLDPDAQAIMWISLLGDERWDPVRMSEYADREISERLAGVRGVGQVQIGGERSYAVRVRLDPARLAAHHLTVQDVVETIPRTTSTSRPGGSRAPRGNSWSGPWVSSPPPRPSMISSSARATTVPSGSPTWARRWTASRTIVSWPASPASRPWVSGSSSRAMPTRSPCRRRCAPD